MRIKQGPFAWPASLPVELCCPRFLKRGHGWRAWPQQARERRLDGPGAAMEFYPVLLKVVELSIGRDQQPAS